MKTIAEHLARLAREIEGELEESRGGLAITVASGSRSQRVAVRRDGEDCVLASVVLEARDVTRNDERWRELARLAWRRNAEHQIVTFAFDDRDRLVGLVRHPAARLHYDELKTYVLSLARECDRLEYLVSGGDVH